MSTETLRDGRVLVTGGTGFLGRRVVAALKKHGFNAVGLGSHRGQWYDQSGADLTNPLALPAYMDCFGPFDAVLHVAGWNGGIKMNLDFPADIFSRNTMMALNVLAACAAHGVKKVVSVVASCAYPYMQWHQGCEAEILYERHFLGSEPHPSVACHGYAKRNLQLASYFYRKQYGLKAVCVCPTTLYGPGDSFDPDRTKVMGAMVKRFVDAVDEGKQEVVCWGTGKAMREFLYVEDAAELLAQALVHYDDSELPLNLGTGQELSIKKLAEAVARCVGFSGAISWDASKPDGQFRKRLDLDRMRQLLPGIEPTPLEEGIRRTVEYYRRWKKQRAAA